MKIQGLTEPSFDEKSCPLTIDDANNIYHFSTNDIPYRSEVSSSSAFVYGVESFKQSIKEIPFGVQANVGGLLQKAGKTMQEYFPDGVDIFNGAVNVKIGDKLVEGGKLLSRTANRNLDVMRERYKKESPRLESAQQKVAFDFGSQGANWTSMLLAGPYSPFLMAGLTMTGETQERLEKWKETHGTVEGYEERQGEDSVWNVANSFVQGTIEKYLGSWAQVKAVKKGWGYVKAIGKNAIQEGFIEEPLQDVTDFYFDKLSGLSEDETLRDRMFGSLRGYIVASIFGGAGGYSAALYHRSTGIETYKDVMKGTVPEQDLEKAATKAYEQDAKTMRDIITVELESSSSLQAKRGEVYESLYKAALEQVKVAKEQGGFPELQTEEDIANYVKSVADRFADETLAEAHRRNTVIEEVLDPSLIRYENGQLVMPMTKGVTFDSTKVREAEEQLKVQIENNATNEEKEENLNYVVSSYEGSENFDVEDMRIEDKQEIFEAKQEQDEMAKVFFSDEQLEKGDEDRVAKYEELQKSQESLTQESVEEYDPEKQYNEYDIVKRKINGEDKYVAYIDDSWNVYESLDEAKNQVEAIRNIVEHRKQYDNEVKAKQESDFEKQREALVYGNGDVTISHIVDALKSEGLWEHIPAKTRGNILAFSDYLITFKDNEMVEYRLADSSYGQRVKKGKKLAYGSIQAIVNLRNKLKSDVDYKEELSSETNEAIQEDSLPEVEKEETVTKGGKIEDFGEKIEGARKDLWQNYLSKIESEMPASAEDIKLSEVFPEPNYEKAIANGIGVDALATIKALRDLIPTKPKSVYKLFRWSATVKSMREIAQNIINSNFSMDTINNILSNPLFKDIRGQVELYRTLGYPYFRNAKGYSIRGALVTQRGEERYPGGKPMFEVRYNNRTVRINGNYYLDSFQEAIDGIKSLLDAPKGDKKVKFDLYSRGGSKEIILGKKVGSGKYLDLHTFETIAEARAYLVDNYDSLVKELEDRKQQPIDRGEVNRARIGDDYRKGKNVSPEEFSDMFGFRGVQFGNWVEQKTRVADLNQAYDALVDLSKILNIPTQAISLNGTLGLAFGARGRKGAAAHYEPDQVVINLTKMQGAGSLAHEWFHALDNSFLRKEDQRYWERYTTETSRSLLIQNNRIEVITAFMNLGSVLSKSELSKRSFEFDKARTNNYWSTIRELGARTFEQYIKDKAKSLGVENDFLVNIVVAEGQDENVYLNENEKAEIYDAFDKLFNTLQTRKTEKGVELYQFIGEKAQGIDKSLLAEAKKMHAMGASKEHTRQTTGWFIGGDGKWRFEISDKDMKIDEKLVKKAGVYNLKDIIEHKELFKMYPFLENIEVTVMDFGRGSEKNAAGIDPVAMTMQINTRSDFDLRISMAHEIQHLIQVYEGFVQGSVPNAFESYKKDKAKQRDKIIDGLVKTELSKQGYNDDDFTALAVREAIKDNDVNSYNKKVSDIGDNWGIPKNVIDDISMLVNQSKEIADFDKKHPDYKDDYEFYIHSGGEVESFVTGESVDLTMEQRLSNTMTERENFYISQLGQLERGKIRYEQEKRGSIEFRGNKALITLTEQSNSSTLAHELAHYWLQNTFLYSKSGLATPEYKQFFNSIAKYLDITDDQETIKEWQQEKWARAAEMYAMGKAPEGMEKPLTQYQQWIRKAYGEMSEPMYIDENGEAKVPEFDFETMKMFANLAGETLTEPEFKQKQEAVRGLAKSTNQMAQAKGMKTELPTYEKRSATDMGKKADEFIQRDKQLAIDIVKGLKPEQEGLFRQDLFAALRELALNEGDSDLLNELSKSMTVEEATELGQRIQALARGRIDPVKQMVELRDERMKKNKVDKKKLKEETEKAKKEIKQEMAEASTPKEWADFIKSLEC